MKLTVNRILAPFYGCINRISLKAHRFKNRNKRITIISRDCLGGILYNQYGLRFLSPTINLFFTPEDFNSFCVHLEDYVNGFLVKDNDNEKKYPVGLLHSVKDDLKVLKVNFMHYKTFEDALNKWEERKQRIQWDKIFVVSTFCYPAETSAVSDTLISGFNSIPFKKVILVDKEYGFDGEFVIRKPFHCREGAWLLSPIGRVITWKKMFNRYDFNKFFECPMQK